MGKPAYLHTQKWLDKKEHLKLIKYCRGLRKEDRQTKESLAIHQFGDNSSQALRDIHELLRVAYFVILEGEGRIFGPVRCKLRQCICEAELSPWGPDDRAQNCPYCGSIAWKKAGSAYYWYMTAGPKEKMEVIRRFGVNADGNLRRLFGGEEFPNIRQNIVKQIGSPMRDLLLKYPELREATKELLAARVLCPNCHSQVLEGKFCINCGSEMT